MQNTQDTPVHLVLSGSGARYPVFVGAIARLQDAGFKPAGVCGTSGGALVAAALATDYEIPDLIRLVQAINPDDLLDSRLGPFSIWGWVFNVAGVYKGDKLLKKLRAVLPKRLSDAKMPLCIVTFDINANRHVVWTNIPGILGTRFAPEADLPLLVRASMSLPVIFDPVMIDKSGQQKTGMDMHVDGGIGANFPLDVWKGVGETVIGLRFRPTCETRSVKSKLQLVGACLDGLIEAVSNEHIEDAAKARIIDLHTKGSSLDFDIGKDKANILIQEGSRSVSDWLRRNFATH